MCEKQVVEIDSRLEENGDRLYICAGDRKSRSNNNNRCSCERTPKLGDQGDLPFVTDPRPRFVCICTALATVYVASLL
jgi:hypothetical protein